MAFFKFRTAAEASGTPRQPESIEAMRRRARHRLIGATVLVLLGIVGFPVLFDTQPRPIPVDIPIDIPDRNKAKPLPAPRAAAPAPVASGKVGTPPAAAPAPAPAVAAAPAPAAPVKPEAAPAKPEPAPAKAEATAKAEAPVPAKPAEAKPAEAKPAAQAKEDGNRAQALLEGKAAKDTAAVEGRFVVQVGAFADVGRAREARQRLERAGLKTYTNVAETKDGRRIRVRVGPFPTRADADKAARKIKGLDMPAAILTL